jgi:hypothetical protein
LPGLHPDDRVQALTFIQRKGQKQIMKLINRFSGFLTIGLLTAVMLLTGCGPNNSATAPQTVAPQAVDQSQATVPVSYAPPQVVELGCPVQSDIELQQIFRGYFGVDGYSRPLNAHGVPVDTNGNCLSTAPVPEVFSAAVAPAYVNVLYARYGYHYYYQPTYVHVYVGSGIIYRRNIAPTGRVIIQTTAPTGSRVVVPVGVSKNVRPGAPTASTTVPVGATSTVKPGAVNPGPAAVPSSVTPPKAAAPTSTFVRPGQTPAGATTTPSSVTPPKAAAPTSTFTRPTAAPAAAPSSVTPPRAAAPTKTFVRPGHK